MCEHQLSRVFLGLSSNKLYHFPCVCLKATSTKESAKYFWKKDYFQLNSFKQLSVNMSQHL